MMLRLMTEPSYPVFSLERRAAPEDIDDLEHVSNLVYLRWVQEVATAHSEAVGYDLATYQRLGAIFVVRRHEIDYLRSALLGDRIELRTWVESWKAASSVRITSIVRLSGPGDLPGQNTEIELARARTTWVLVSTSNSRPVRIPQELRDAFLQPASTAPGP